MSHLPDPKLYVWKNGDKVSAAVLNHSFAALHGLAEAAAALALQPDPDIIDARERLAATEERLGRLEKYAVATERERNTRAYMPMAAYGELLKHIQELAGPLRAQTAQLRGDAESVRQMHGAVESRIATLEANPAPPAPSIEAFEAMRRELDAARAEAHAANVQLAGLRADIAGVYKFAAASDRERNSREYAPLAMVGELLARIAALEGRA